MILKGSQERKKEVKKGKWEVIADESPGSTHSVGFGVFFFFYFGGAFVFRFDSWVFVVVVVVVWLHFFFIAEGGLKFSNVEVSNYLKL